MADKKISDLNHLGVAAATDLYVVVDVDQAETKNIRKDALFGSPGPIGWNNANTGEFTLLTLNTGVSVSAILNETDLASNSATALATQYSVKTYVDSQIGATSPHNLLSGIQGGDSTNRYHLTFTEHDELTAGGYTSLHMHPGGDIDHDTLGGLNGGDTTTGYYHLTMIEHGELTGGGVTSLHTHPGSGVAHNTLNNLQGGDSTADEFYHLTQSIHDGLYSASPVIGLGSATGTNLEVDYGANEIRLNVNGNLAAYFQTEAILYYNGLKSFQTSVDGVYILDTSGNNPTVSFFQDDGTTFLGNMSFDVGGIFNIYDGINSDYYLRGQPNANIELYFAGTKTLATEEAGDGRGLRIFSGSNEAVLRINSTNANAQFKNFAPSGSILILGTNSAVAESTLTTFDPNGAVELYYNGTKVFETTSDGIKLNLGAANINEFSIDGTFAGNSDTAVPTEKAVKTYVDAQISQEIITGQEPLINGDTTSSIFFSSSESDTNYSISYSMVNIVDVSPSMYASIVTEKTVDGFTVAFSGEIDSSNYSLDWSITR